MGFVLREGIGGGATGSETDVMVRRLPGRTKSLVRLPIAHDDPLPADQPVNIDGHAAQVYKFTDHVRFAIALVPGDGESWPRSGSQLQVGLGEGIVPAEAGTYPTLDLSGMTLIVTVDGVQYQATLAQAIHQDVVAPIGPGHRGQTGPDLLRRKHYLLRLKRQGVAGAGVASDYLTCADVHVTTRVDMDLAQVEFLWMAGQWRSTDNPFQTNPVVNGHAYFDNLRIPRTSLPAGYAVELFTPHPYSSVTVDNVLGISPMTSSSDVHWIAETGQYAFRFAVYNPATVTQPTARKVLDGWDRGWAISGPLSYHRTHAFGERRDVMLDLQHFRTGTQGEEVQWRDPVNPNLDVWQAMEVVATEAANHFTARVQNPTSGDRYGWGFRIGPTGAFGPGGEEIYGNSVPFQARAYFELATRRLDALATRTALSMVDIIDGRCLNDSKLVDNNNATWTDLSGATPGQVGFLPYLFNSGQLSMKWVHPHFTHAHIDVSSRGGNPAQFRLAPEALPWNNPPSGKTCPYRPHMDWQLGPYQSLMPFMTSHSSRYLTSLRDMLWLYDDPIAHRLLEEIVSTRCMLPLPRYDKRGPAENDYDRGAGTLPYIVAQNTAPPRWGGWRTPQSGGGYFQGDNQRAYAWPMTLAAMYWWVANDAEKARIHGPLSSGTSGSWFRTWLEWGDAVFMDSGFGLRTDSDNLDPNPFNPARFGPTDLANRRGAYPRDSPGQNRATCVSGFHITFLTGAVFALKYGPLRDDAVNRGRLDRNLRVAIPWAANGAANYPTGDYKGCTYDLLLSPTGGNMQTPPFTLAQHLAGESRWTLTDVLNGGVSLETRNFQGWASLYGLRDTDDPAMLDVIAGDRNAPPGSEVALFNQLEAEFRAKWSNLNGDFRKLPLDDHTWWSGLLAELVYRRNAVQ